MNDDEIVVFNYLLDTLPLHAEEDSIREEILESEIIELIRSRDDSISIDIRAVVYVIRKILLSLALLDESKIRENKWAFVSFPASLLARSVLETLSREESRFFRHDYWSQGGRSDEEIEAQRVLIKSLETERIKNDEIAHNPIRTVHVAWGIIRLGPTFLLFKREDKIRPEVKGFSFVGGRLNIRDDLPAEKYNATSLKEINKIDSVIAAKCLEATLVREMEEETLLQKKDYRISNTHSLSPYSKIEGPRNHHAYTQYNISMNSIKLTKDGELKLLERISNKPDLFKWFSIEEFIVGSKPDGSRAFVDALVTDPNIQEVSQFLDSFEDSSSNPLRLQKDEDSIELPSANTNFLRRGKAGKQKDIPISISEKEWELLMLLGWHTRSLEIRNLTPRIVLLGGGWVKLSGETLTNLASGLASKLNGIQSGLIEFHSIGFCRLSILPDRLFFQPECFSYYWNSEKKDKQISVDLRPINTRYGHLEAMSAVIALTPTLVNAMFILVRNELNPSNEVAVENEDTVIRQFNEQTKNAKKEIGLRQFIKTNQYSIVRLTVPRKPS